MKSDGHYIQGYNCQLAVDSDYQVIVAIVVSNRTGTMYTNSKPEQLSMKPADFNRGKTCTPFAISLARLYAHRHPLESHRPHHP